MENKILEVGIGTKEPEKLVTKQVIVHGAKKEDVISQKDNKKIGEKVIFICKHPDKEDYLNLSKVKYIKGKNVTESGTWFKEDEDGNIQKGSALAITLNHYNVPKIGELVGKPIETDYDDNGYICIKAY